MLVENMVILSVELLFFVLLSYFSDGDDIPVCWLTLNAWFSVKIFPFLYLFFSNISIMPCPIFPEVLVRLAYVSDTLHQSGKTNCPGFTQLTFMILSSGLTCLHFTQPIRSHHLLHAPMIDSPNCTYYRGPLEKWISSWADTHLPVPRSLNRTQWRDHRSPFGRFS
jgi:hypothetical protein